VFYFVANSLLELMVFILKHWIPILKRN